jgi:hypothetical protein
VKLKEREQITALRHLYCFVEDGRARAKRFMGLKALLIDLEDLRCQLLCRGKGGNGDRMAN